MTNPPNPTPAPESCSNCHDDPTLVDPACPAKCLEQFGWIPIPAPEVAGLVAELREYRYYQADYTLLRRSADALEAQSAEKEDLKREYDEKCERVHRLREAGNHLRNACKSSTIYNPVLSFYNSDEIIKAIAAWDALTASGAESEEEEKS